MMNILFKYKEIILEIKYVKKFQDLENLRLFGYHAFRHTSAEYRHKNRESEKSHHEVKINCVLIYFLINICIYLFILQYWRQKVINEMKKLRPDSEKSDSGWKLRRRRMIAGKMFLKKRVNFHSDGMAMRL